MSDDSFREAYKPLHIPAHYDYNAPEQERVLFALALLGEGTIMDVVNEMAVLEPTTPIEDFINSATNVLMGLYQKGLLKGAGEGSEMRYNLSKITEANEGSVDPGSLAPD